MKEKLRNDPRPLYQQVQESIIRRISNGSYKPGEQIPREEELAANLGVSRTTIRTALGNLETMGYLRRIHGAGTFIAKRRVLVEYSLDTLESLHPHVTAKMGLSSRLTNVSIAKTQADDRIAKQMELSEGAWITKVSYGVEAEGTPIAFFDTYIPESIVTIEAIQAGFDNSIIDFFNGQAGRPRLVAYRMVVGITRAESPMTELLDVSMGSNLLLWDGKFYAEDEQFIGLSIGHLVPECVKIQVERRVLVHKTAI